MVRGYFVVCDECSSSCWVDFEDNDCKKEIINELLENGDVLYSYSSLDSNNSNWDGKSISVKEKFICQDCEKENRAIPFHYVSKEMRMRIYKMNEEERINWVRNFWTIYKLKEEDKQV